MTQMLDVQGAQASAAKEVVPAKEAVDGAKLVVIKNDEDFTGAVEAIQVLTDRADAIQSIIDEKVKPAEDAIKELKAFFKEPMAMYREAVAQLKVKVGGYWDGRVQERDKEQRKLAASAEKKKKRLLQRASEARNKGDFQKAAELEAEAHHGVVPAILDDPYKPQGFSVRAAWKGKVVDKVSLINAVAAGDVDASLLTVDTKALNSLATATAGTRDVPGVTFYRDTTVVIRRKGGE